MRRRALPVTTLPLSPDEDRHRRMVRYAVMMGIRVVCIALMVIIPWPWALVPALGAVFLPYFAVLVANAVGATGRRRVERPEDRHLLLWEEELQNRSGDDR